MYFLIHKIVTPFQKIATNNFSKTSTLMFGKYHSKTIYTRKSTFYFKSRVESVQGPLQSK